MRRLHHGMGMTNKTHTNTALEGELGSVREEILAMGRLVESHVGDAIRSLAQRDTALATRVVDADRAVNQMELAVDEQCIRILALYQPEASDLRFVASALKMVTDLERIGDLAVNMAECALMLIDQPALPAEAAIPGLAEQAQSMLRDVLDAFVKGDPVKARQIIAADAMVEEPVRRLCSEVKMEMESNPQTVDRGVALLFLAKRIERMADHVANVAEMVVYYVRGQDIRHAKSL